MIRLAMFSLALAVTIVGVRWSVADQAALDFGDTQVVTPTSVDPLADAASTVTCDDGTVSLAAGNSLLVRSLAVVNHGDAEGVGAWSFGGLMTKLTPAGYPGGAAGFTRDWLAEWETDRVVNGVPTPRVTNIRDKLIDSWPRNAAGALDLERSPFRLLAIANRVDRYDLAAGRAGELRFVFSALESNARFPGRQLPMNFTVIFEFGMPGSSLAAAKASARQWAALSDVPVESAAYHSRLRALTDGVLAAARTNLRAVRSNEVSLDDPWDLRHFTLASGATDGLRLTALAMTPMIRTNRSGALTRWMFESAERRADIALGKHRLPDEVGATKLRGNFAPMTMVAEGDRSFRWETDGSQPNTDAVNDTRHAFSLFTCNGCHSGETGTAALHIVPRRKDEISALSGFMTGKTMPDIVRPGQQRHFDELARRRRVMERLVCGLDAADADRSFDE